MRNIIQTLRFLLIVALSALPIRATAQPATEEIQTKSRPAFGAFGDINVNMAHANFTQLPGFPDCNALYQSGSGMGPSLGVFYELPIENKFSFLIRGAFSMYGEKLASNELAPIAIGGVETAGTIEHSITATLGMIGIQPMLNFHILPAFSVRIGTELGFVLTSSFAQIETITQPTTSGVFDNGLRTRNSQSGKIPNANGIVASLLGGVSYQLPLNTLNTLQLVPELCYSYGLTPVAKNIQWSVNSLRGGVAIRYELPESPTPKIPTAPVDTIPPPPPPPPVPTPIASISAIGVESNGEETSAANLRIEEIYSVQMKPTLPYIFFEPSEKTLPERYVRLAPQQATDFSELQLRTQDALAINHQTLNVIGRRLTNNKEATITLAGITLRGMIDNKLAFERAETVAAYLKSTWHIAPERIRISTHALPKEIVTAVDSDGISEANRVEIASNSFDILQPVMGSDTIRSVTPPMIRFRPTVQNGGAISEWSINATQDGILLKKYEGTGALPEKIDWILADDQAHIPRSPGKIEFQFRVTNAAHQVAVANGNLAVEQISLRKKQIQRMADREIEKYNLLLFDLQSSEISQTNKQIIDLIQQHLKDVSTITIIGHTDRTGEAESNKRLSLERARNTARALGLTKASVRGIANEIILYDNSLPEGRCLSRTVDIIIETPGESP